MVNTNQRKTEEKLIKEEIERIAKNSRKWKQKYPSTFYDKELESLSYCPSKSAEEIMKEYNLDEEYDYNLNLQMNFLNIPELDSYVLRLKCQYYTTSILFSLKNRNDELLYSQIQGFLIFIAIKNNLSQEEIEKITCHVLVDDILIEEVLFKESKNKLENYINILIRKVENNQVMDDFMKKLENNHFDITEPQMGVEFNPTPETVEQHQQNYQKLLESELISSFEEENVITKKRTLNN